MAGDAQRHIWGWVEGGSWGVGVDELEGKFMNYNSSTYIYTYIAPLSAPLAQLAFASTPSLSLGQLDSGN